MAEEKGQQLPFQSKANKEIANWVMNRLMDMKMTRNKNGDQNWDRWDQLYRNEPTGNPPEEWQANIFIPFVMSTVLAIISEITDRRPRWKILPQSPSDAEKAQVLQAVTDFTMEKGRYDDEALKRDMDKMLYGTSVWKEFYREDRRVIKDKDGKDKDIREFQDVYGKHIPLRNFYLDDKALDIREARDCIERRIMDINDFRTRYSKYRTSGKVKKWGFIKPESENTVKNLPPGGDVNREGFYIPVSDIKDNEVEVIEYWNKPNDEHVIVANGVVIVNEPIPYDHKQLPYAMDIAIPLPNSAYGIGVPETLEGSQEEINALHNMMLDEAKLTVHTPILMGGMTLVDEDEFTLRPKAIIPVDDVNQARELRTQGVTASHFQMIEDIKQNIRTAAGLDLRFAEAQQPKGAETATEVLALQESSLRRIGLFTKMLEIRCLPRIAMLRTANIQQFYQDPLRVEHILDDAGEIVLDENTGKPKFKAKFRTIRNQPEGKTGFDFMEVTPEKVRANVDVQVIPQSTQPLNRSVLAKRFNTALNTVLAFPQTLEIIDMPELLRHYFQTIDLPTAVVKDTLSGPENDDFDLANQENIDMANGKTVPPTTNPSLKHTAIHGAFIFILDQNGRPSGQFTEQYANLSADAKEAILNHYQGELSQHAAKGNIGPAAQERTPNVGQGIGTQESAPGGAETAAVAQGG